MKANIHPHYRHVVFHDTSADVWFKIGSTIKTDRTVEFEGETLPYVPWMCRLPHMCSTPANRKILPKRAAPRALTSVSGVFLERNRGEDHAGIKLAAFSKKSPSGL